MFWLKIPALVAKNRPRDYPTSSQKYLFFFAKNNLPVISEHFILATGQQLQ